MTIDKTLLKGLETSIADHVAEWIGFVGDAKCEETREEIGDIVRGGILPIW